MHSLGETYVEEETRKSAVLDVTSLMHSFIPFLTVCLPKGKESATNEESLVLSCFRSDICKSRTKQGSGVAQNPNGM